MQTFEEVKIIREELGVGLETAKSIYMHRKLLDQIDKAETIEDLKPILKQLVPKIRGDYEDV